MTTLVQSAQLALLELKDSLEIILEDQLALLELKNLIEILINDFKKAPDYNSYINLKNYVFENVLDMFYLEEHYDKQLLSLIKEI